jgi:hypothetical protein
MKRYPFSLISLVVLTLATTIIVSAQGVVRPPVPRGSQKATVAQTIGTTEVAITYSRPAVKDRANKIFGDWPTAVAGEATLDNQNARPKDAPVVPWGHIWRAGANEATMFTTTDDVLINGQLLPAGKYSFHVIPAKDGEWTLIFNKELDWGSFTYKAAQDALRVKTKAEAAPFNMEFLTYYFDPVGEKSATVHLRWEKMDVPFNLEVKDVVGSTMTKLKTYVSGAKPDEWQRPLNAANYAKTNKLTEYATRWYDEAIKAIDLQVAAKPNFVNYRQKANILLSAGRNQEALVAAEKAVEVGKAENADAAQVAALEKRIADIKAGKN